MKPFIFYSGQKDGPFGWGTFGREVSHYLAKLFPVSPGSPDVLIQPCQNETLRPSTAQRGRYNIGVSFFETALPDEAVANAAQYDTIFVGSTWCLDRLIERGIMNGKVLIQGVDHLIFKPGFRYTDSMVNPYRLGQKDCEARMLPAGFRIFSGGKFEWRKGQDLVIAAFAQFSKTHPDAHLVCAWFNPWAELVGDMMVRSALTIPACHCPTQSIFFENYMLTNGIPLNRFTVLPQCSQERLAAEMRHTNVGLFPNRCEGGTNLVLMEYAACGGKVIANALTGHADVAPAIDFLIRAEDDENHWAKQSVDKIVEAMEIAHSARGIAKHTYDAEKRWTWEATAKTIAMEIERLTGTK
jgi:glycosyltransferase involved in cell wall biosynthesis